MRFWGYKPPAVRYPRLRGAELHESQSITGRFRLACRTGRYSGPTRSVAAFPGLDRFVQANLVVLSSKHAVDFERFCRLNTDACPLLDVVMEGESPRIAPWADLRTDLPRYRVFRHGAWRRGDAASSEMMRSDWPKESVGFLIGCSYSWESALDELLSRENGESVVPMYRTRIRNAQSGVFGGHLVVSCRRVPRALLDQAVELTSRYPLAHGAPLMILDTEKQAETVLGLTKPFRLPDWGAPLKAVSPQEEADSVLAFWACGVTPQQAIEEAGSLLDSNVVTHAPGHMFVTDLAIEDLDPTASYVGPDENRGAKPHMSKSKLLRGTLAKLCEQTRSSS